MAYRNVLLLLALVTTTACFEIRLNGPGDKKQESRDDKVYKLDVDLIRAKLSNRNGKTLRRSRIDLKISDIEASFSWTDLIKQENRLAVGFSIFQGRKFVDNVVLYSPRDSRFRVQGLKDGTEYMGSIRIIKDRSQIQQLNSSEGDYHFRLDSPRIILEKDKERFDDFISKLASNKVKLDSSSVTFKLPNRIKDHYILEVSNTNETSVISKTEIHIVPYSKTIILNDLPPNSVMRMVLRRINSSSTSGDATTSYLFTGSLTSEQPTKASSITRIVMYNKERMDLYNKLNNNLQAATVQNVEKTVPCHVVNRRPFDGYPCPQSQVCLPLHWICDGQQDCPGGTEEVGCNSSYLRTEPATGGFVEKKCTRHESSCVMDNITMCFPNKWLCDGRLDCPDGWDEKQANCPSNVKTYTLTGLTQGIRRITNLILRCRGSHFRCRSGECIADDAVCDGVNHCDDASDELYCENDGYDDEDDDDDDTDDVEDSNYVAEYEFRCHPRYEFKCYRSYSYSSRRCIPKAWLCDAFQDCPYGEDENTNFCSHQHLFQGYF